MMKTQYELSLAQYEHLYKLFLEQSELHHKRLNESVAWYAPDLYTIGQKRIRIRNGAIRYAVTMFMRHYQMGIVLCESVNQDVQHPWGLPVGHVDYYYRTNKDFEACKVFLMKELRSMAIMTNKAIA